MRYLLYLRRSLTRCPQKHVSLCLILTCAFLLPLLVSLYRDSDDYGNTQEMLAASKGYSFHIQNVTEEDCQYFEGIIGLSDPVFEDGTIYLKITNEADWKNEETFTILGWKIQECMESAGLDSAVVNGYDYDYAHGISTDSVHLSQQNTLLIVDLILIVFSALIVQSTYRNHLQHFASDMRTLNLCGASWRQIDAIFLVELIAAFTVSSICALAVSIGVLKILFWLFLEVRDVEGMATLIFHVDAKNTAFHLLVYFLCLAAALCYSLTRFHKNPTLSVGDVSPDKIRKKQMRICSTPARSLAGLWRQRTNKALRGCVWISAPIMFIALFLFEYQMLDIDYLTRESEYEIIVSNYMGGFADSDIDYVQAMEEVACVNAYRDTATQYHVNAEDGQFYQVRLLSLDSVSGNKPALEKYEAAVSKNCEQEGFTKGAQIQLSPIYAEEVDNTMASLVITDVLDVPTVSWAVDVYVNEELWLELTESLPVTELEIQLKDVSSHALAVEKLQSHFGAGYTIRDNQEHVDFVQTDFSAGVYLLLIYIFAILFLLAVLILYVKLQEYVNDCTEFARELYIIGASKKTLHRSFLLQTAASAVPAAVLPAVGSLAAAWLAAKSVYMPLPMSGGIVLVYLAVAALTAAIFICPVHFTLKKNMKNF